MSFQKAERKRAFLKIAITGPSGSGKTYGALKLAFGLAPKGRIAVIDTENHSASLYADMGDYDVLVLEPPYISTKYLDAIREAVEARYDVLIVDSLSHEWQGEGGILSRKEQVDSRGGNSFTNWAPFTREHEAFKAGINDAPIHIIATMRSKQDYVIDSGSGKAAPKKVGLAPIQREGFEYEFTTVFDVAINHEAAVSKDRTGLWDGIIGKLDESHGKRLATWLDGAAAPGLSTNTLRALHAEGKAIGIDHDGLHTIAIDRYSVASLSSLTEAQGIEFGKWIRSNPDDARDALKSVLQGEE